MAVACVSQRSVQDTWPGPGTGRVFSQLLPANYLNLEFRPREPPWGFLHLSIPVAVSWPEALGSLGKLLAQR